jgi:ADP-heptose:LPS heptosyltransferase
MRILALQLKRIGDLILTTPALSLLQAARPDVEITLAVHAGAAPLLPAIPGIAAGIVFGPKRGWTPWQQTLTGPWEAVLDFTGTDRSAFATAFSHSPHRIAFEWVRKGKIRALAYNEFVDSAVREFHTVDHYAQLLRPLGVEPPAALEPRLVVPAASKAQAARLLAESGVDGRFAIVHPGAARAEKFWDAGRWARVIRHLRSVAGVDCVLTGGADASEAAHLEEVRAAVRRGGERGAPDGRLGRFVNLAGAMDLLALAAVVEKAQLVVSCDTAIVHLAAAFQRPQVALFGPTNPFHWRPRHARAVVLSAARPEAPLTEFDPRLKGAPMDRLSTEVVIRATDFLLERPATSANP